MAIPESFIEEIKDRNDIVDVISGYVRLTKKSGPNHTGLCPFHSEKTPSFNVNSDRQIYHCFGCGEGGGVINFIMKIENVSFRDAVEILADRAGLKMPEEDDPNVNLRKRLLALNKESARFYRERLLAPDGERCRAYLAERQLTPSITTRFGLGYAPDGWSELYKAMRAKGFTDHELFTAQLVRRGNNGSYYDVFRNRLMFPVINVHNDVIGFSGRDIGGSTLSSKSGGYSASKYMNSPETPVFVKGHSIFAMNFAKTSKENYFILVEGNVDVVSLHQAGFTNAIASLGTALTADQARLISNYKQEVVICYDNDVAGEKATAKAIEIFEKLDVKTRVLRISGVKDPDEYIKLYGSAAFKNLLEAAPLDIDYRLVSCKAKYNLADSGQKVSFVKEAAALVASSPDKIRRSIYAQKIAADAGLPESVVSEEIEKRHKKLVKDVRSASDREEMKTTVSLPTGNKKITFSDTASAAAESGLIRLLLADPSVSDRTDIPDPSEFTVDFYRHIYSVVLGRLRMRQSVSPDALSTELDSSEISAVVSLSATPLAISNSDQLARDYTKTIRSHSFEPSSLMELQARLRKEKSYRNNDSQP